MEVETLLRDIENQDLVLPEFQREFVWQEQDVKTFIQSIYKGYPTGSLLIWKTLNPPKLKGKIKPSDNVYTRVLLDGQQRLTALYLFLKNKSPPYYPEMSKKFNLYFNVETEEFRYYQKSIMTGKEWISILDFFKQGNATNFIKNSLNKEYYFNFLEPLSKLENIKSYDYFVDEEKLGKLNEIREIVRIFNLVNKQGRTLLEEDLALAHVCVFWPEIKDLFRKELKLLENKGFKFSFNFLILCLNCVATGHAKFESFYNCPGDKIKESWERLKKSLEYLVNILHNNAYINSTESYELKSEALLVPLIVYLANNNYEFKNEKILNKFLYWFFNALMWGRYTRRGKSSPLEQDIVTITRENTPESLIHNFEREVPYFEVKEENIKGAPITSPFFNMMFTVAKSKKAVDWFNGNLLHSRLIGNSYRLHKHHVFPKDVLKKEGYYKDVEKKKMVNEIANRVFLTERANIQIRNTKPEKYLNKVVEKYPDSLKKQMVSENQDLWKIENFPDFLRDRRQKIAKEINKFMKRLVEKEIPEMNINELIKQEESYNLEFKSTYSWNLEENKVDKEMKFSILKTIIGFMNANGGTLLIGVADDHKVVGLDNDYKSNWKGNKDGFLLDFRSFVEKIIGINSFKRYIHLEFEKINEKEICLVQVEKSLDPIFFKQNGKKIMFIRLGNKTDPIDDPEEINKYIEDNWK